MQAHIELLARDLEREGKSPADALAAARRQVGNLGQLREQSRDYWGFPVLETIAQDLRFAVRGLRRAPGFTATVVITLALGIGANAAMFGVIDRLMFRPFPRLREPSAVHRVYLQTTFQGTRRTNAVFPYSRYRDLECASTSFSQVAAWSDWRLPVGSGEATRIHKVTGTTASYFDFFDAPPSQGRYYSAAEDSLPAGTLVAVLSHDYWQSDFGRSDVVGQPLQIGTLNYTIIGVAAAGFVGTSGGRAPELFVPITIIPANINPSSRTGFFVDYRWDWTEMMVRRRPGVSQSIASADLSRALVMSRNIARAIPHGSDHTDGSEKTGARQGGAVGPEAVTCNGADPRG